MYTLIVPSRPAIDQRWFDALHGVMSRGKEVFLLLEPAPEVLKERRKQFEDSGYSINLDLRPLSVDIVSLQAQNDALCRLADEIRTNEPNPYIKDAYIARIEEYFQGNAMVLATVQGDYERFLQTNDLLYGTPQAELFAAAVAWVREDAYTTTVDHSEKLANFRDTLLGVLPHVEGGNPRRIMPSEAVFRAVRDMHIAPGGYRDQLLGAAHLPHQAYIDQQNGDVLCRQIITNIGSDYTLADSQDGIWAVVNSAKKVIRPLEYRLDLDEFFGIACHEIGSHLLESANGSRQPLRLLGLGLAHFESGNEGRAFLREQIVYKSEAEFTRQPSWEYILLLYLGVCLASGCSGRAYGFAELYDVMFALHRFWRERRFPDVTSNERIARDEAWHLAVRVMKGSSGNPEQPGCYMKDIVYLEGNVACWDVAAQDPEMILRGDIGKFNIANPEHVRILRGLNII